MMAVDDADGNGGPFADKAVAAGEFQKKNVDIDHNDERGDDGESASGGREASPSGMRPPTYIPPLPSRIPMP